MPCLAERLLRLTDHGNLGDGVDAVRQKRRKGADLQAERIWTIWRGAPVHAGGGEGRKSNHVARGKDVGDVRPVFLVDRNDAALAGDDASLVETELIRVALSASCDENRIYRQ